MLPFCIGTRWALQPIGLKTFPKLKQIATEGIKNAIYPSFHTERRSKRVATDRETAATESNGKRKHAEGDLNPLPNSR